MCESKILLYPSNYESNSNTIREAYFHKCLPLITTNVGYCELFPAELICDNFNIQEWKSKLSNLLTNYNKIKNIEIKFKESIHELELLI